MRRPTKYVFYYIVVQLAKAILRDPGEKVRPREITEFILSLAHHPDCLFDSLTETAALLIDQYFDDASALSYVNDPGWVETKNIETFVQSNRLDEWNISSKAPLLRQSIDMEIRSLRRSVGREPSDRDRYLAALSP